MGRKDATVIMRAVFTIRGKPVTVHALQTGTVTVKKAHAQCCVPEMVPYPLRFVTILLDPRFAEPMPVWTFAIEHPEAGLICVDSGSTPKYNDINAWPGTERIYRFVHSFIRLQIDDDSTLHSRLTQVGYDPTDVRALVLSHTHVDHTLGVPSFPDADIWTTAAEDVAGNRIGAMPFLWRSSNTKIRHVDVEGRASDTVGLGAMVDFSTDGSLSAIHTPGHTPGSVSVRLRTDQCDLWFCGDTSFTADSMDPNQCTAGIHTDIREVRSLQRTLRQLGGVFLPSHDWSVPERLKQATELKPRSET